MVELSSQSVKSLMPLVAALADGQIHSGEELGAALGVSRTAVWKQLKKLESIGLQVNSVKGAGYQLDGALDLIDVDSIGQKLQDKSLLIVEPCINSTNAHVASLLNSGVGEPVVCAAEMQTAGRGRRGRNWVSPFAKNLYFSVGFASQEGVTAFEGLSLAVGVEIAAAIGALMGDVPLCLKWPNDVLVGGKKLAGILIEVDGDLSGACNIVIGVGINHSMSALAALAIDQPWVDLHQVASEHGLELPDRTAVLSTVSSAIVDLLAGYPGQGFHHYRQRWQALDCYYNQEVAVITGGRKTFGVARGVDEQGALKVLVDGQERRFNGGEVSLRGLE